MRRFLKHYKNDFMINKYSENFLTHTFLCLLNKKQKKKNYPELNFWFKKYY